MQSILKEKLVRQAEQLSEISETYLSDSSSFVAKYLNWISQTEKELSSIRSPFSIIFQAEKSKVKSVEDGFVPEYIQSEKSPRKIQRAVTAQSLNKISQEIYLKIESIDKELSEINEKLCHAVALLASKENKLFKELETNEISVNKILKLLSVTPETIPMYNYFCSKLSFTDIKYLLFDIIRNLLNNRKNS